MQAAGKGDGPRKSITILGLMPSKCIGRQIWTVLDNTTMAKDAYAISIY